jgi:hypothetical protein
VRHGEKLREGEHHQGQDPAAQGGRHALPRLHHALAHRSAARPDKTSTICAFAGAQGGLRGPVRALSNLRRARSWHVARA